MKPLDLYSDTYYESFNGTFQNASYLAPVKNYGSTTTFIRGCLVLLLRAGFVLVQLGSVPIENVYIILLQNIVDIAVCIASFGLIGYILAFGKDGLHGIVGYGMWLTSTSANLDNAILGFSACIIATAIITTLLSGRIHFVGYLLTSLIFSMLFQPIVMHWVWHEYGWMHRNNFMGHLVSIKDYAGGLTIHFTAGMVGFLGALLLGRRLMKLSDIDESSIGAESPGSTITGYIFIALGLIAFSLPSPSYELTHIPENYIGIVLVNNIMAMAAGIIVVVILQFLFYRETFNYWIILRCMQGAIAGIVSISSGIDVYNPVLAFLIATVAAVLFYFVVIFVHNSSVEDYCNIVPIHLVCGFGGMIVPPLFGTTENLGTSIASHIRILHLGWQLLCVATICICVIITFLLLFIILYAAGFLRNKTEEINHRRAVTASIKGPERCFLQRLFSLYPSTPFIEPGSFGKSPAQYHTYGKPQSITSNIPELDTKNKKKTQFINESAKISSVKTDFVSMSFQTTNKPRSVHTLGNINKLKEPAKVRIDSLECSGDIGRTDDKQNIEKVYQLQKLDEVATSVGKRFSYYELHRTKKCTNLFRNRRAVRKRVYRTIGKINLAQSNECISYDNKYNDGFITFKMPTERDLADLSDNSE